MKYAPEVVEQALYEIAACGGNVTRAVRNLHDRGITQAYPKDGGAPIPVTVVREWKLKRFRNRYHELVTVQAREREAIVSSRGIDLAIQIAEAEQEAVKQTLAGMSDATAYEASQILRNLTQSKRTQVDQAHAIAEQGQVEKVSQTLDHVVEGLKRLGVLVDDDQVTDAEVVDDDAHELDPVDS